MQVMVRVGVLSRDAQPDARLPTPGGGEGAGMRAPIARQKHGKLVI